MNAKLFIITLFISLKSILLFSQTNDSLRTENQAKQIEQLKLDVNKLSQRNKELNAISIQSLAEKKIMSNNLFLFSIVVLFLMLGLGYAVYNNLSSKTEKILNQKNNELDQKFAEHSAALKTEMNQKTLQLKNSTLYSLRGLYINAPKETKLVWLIRYCEAFYDFNEFDALILKLQEALNELNEIENFAVLYEHADDMKKILNKMAKSTNKKIGNTSLNLLKELNNFIEAGISNTTLNVN